MKNFNYFFSQAKKNIFRNGFMSIASLFTITSCLIILGIFTLLTLNVNYITEQVKEQCELQLFMNKDADESRVKAIMNEITAFDNVKSAELFTKEDMLEFAKKDMFEGKEEQLTGFEDDNPFSDSYKIRLKDISIADETAERLTVLDDVERVVNKQGVVDIIVSVSNAVKKVSVIIMLLLLVVSIVIMSNTIKLTVFNRRKEISIMKYIGATDSFIKIPFVIEGTIIGFLGAVVSFAAVMWGYIILEKFVAEIGFDMMGIVHHNIVAIILGIMFVIMGCFIGIIGSVMSMRKYLNV